MRLVLGAVVGAALARWLRVCRHTRARYAAEDRVAGLLTEPLRTSPILRVLFRCVVALFDLGLGRIVGHRFLQLTHRGRRSSRLYRTVLEVISFEPWTGESVALSAWGERADWYRNIQTSPAVQVLTGGQRFTPEQRFVESDELYGLLQDYLSRNRVIAPIVRRTLGLSLDGSSADRAMLEAHGYRGVAFRPAGPG
jgi:deazaflavin-dependent oxidoreductase (nitroreductase family)